jgi:hypothetical protein
MEILQPYVNKKKKKKSKRGYRQHPAGTIIAPSHTNPYTATAFGQYAQPTFYQIPQYISPYEQNSRILKNLETMVEEQKSLPTKIGSIMSDYASSYGGSIYPRSDFDESDFAADLYDDTDPHETNVMQHEPDDKSQALIPSQAEPKQQGTFYNYMDALNNLFSGKKSQDEFEVKTNFNIPSPKSNIAFEVSDFDNPYINIGKHKPITKYVSDDNNIHVSFEEDKPLEKTPMKLNKTPNTAKDKELKDMNKEQIDELFKRKGGKTGRGINTKAKLKFLREKLK